MFPIWLQDIFQMGWVETTNQLRIYQIYSLGGNPGSPNSRPKNPFKKTGTATVLLGGFYVAWLVGLGLLD